jgi:hypothetical protein
MISNIVTIFCFASFLYGVIEFDALYFLPAMIWGAFHSVFILEGVFPMWSTIAYCSSILLIVAGASCIIALRVKGAYKDDSYHIDTKTDERLFSAGRWLVMTSVIAYMVGYAGHAMQYVH